MYKVGSPMKGCAHCGDVVVDEDTGRARYVSGFQVFRAYKPWNTGWTWMCAECGAKDLRCWAPDQDGMVEAMLGKEPIVGTREAVGQRKYELRKSLAKAAPAPDPQELARKERIRQLEAKLEVLLQLTRK